MGPSSGSISADICGPQKDLQVNKMTYQIKTKSLTVVNKNINIIYTAVANLRHIWGHSVFSLSAGHSIYVIHSSVWYSQQATG